MRDSDFRIASARSSGGAGERMSRAGRGLIPCRRITCGLPFRSSSKIPGTMITACGRLPVSNIANFTIDEQAAAGAALVLDHPVGTLGTVTRLCTLCLNCTKAGQGLQLDREGVSAVPKMEASCSLDKDQARADAWIEA
jgi:hypothetical protein